MKPKLKELYGISNHTFCSLLALNLGPVLAILLCRGTRLKASIRQNKWRIAIIAVSIFVALVFIPSCRATKILPFDSSINQTYHVLKMSVSDTSAAQISIISDNMGIPIAWGQIVGDSAYVGFFHQRSETNMEVVTSPNNFGKFGYWIIIIIVGISFIVILVLFLTKQ